MKKLVYTDNIGFDMSDWTEEPIDKVYAGTDCIMATTQDGRTLQKITEYSASARTIYWTRIKQISISKWCTGLALGLISDGTCMVSKRALRRICGLKHGYYPFERVHNEIKEWKNMIQTAVSDSFFALDQDGRVHISALNAYLENDYREVVSWENICRIVPGTQHSLFGITRDGRVRCAGTDLKMGPHRDIAEKTASLSGVTDVFPTGSECERIYFAFRDGSVRDLSGTRVEVITSDDPPDGKLFDGTFNYNVLVLDRNNRLVNCMHPSEPVFSADGKVTSFASGDIHYGPPFALAVLETGK